MNIAQVIVNVSDYNDKLVEIPLFTLLQWKHALGLELKGITIARKKISTHIRKVLSAPRSYTLYQLDKYICETIEDVKSQVVAVDTDE